MTNFSNAESLFVRYAAPTICGIKPANLFTLSESQFTAEDLQKWESNLNSQNLCMTFFKTSFNRWMIFVYNLVWIRQIVSDPFIQAYLRGKGYTVPSETLLTLKQLFNHLQNPQNFPHEIGLFLGYPIEDVIGFEENHGKNCKYCGYWKSYSDTSEAKTCCAKYKEAVNANAEVVFGTADSADAAAVLACDVILLGSPAMGDEVLEDTMEEFYTGIESSLSGKKVGLFGSYDWGDGQWLRDWEDRAKSAGANVVESLMVHLTPEGDDITKCQDWAKSIL